jgi:hypothetical protein
MYPLVFLLGMAMLCCNAAAQNYSVEKSTSTVKKSQAARKAVKKSAAKPAVKTKEHKWTKGAASKPAAKPGAKSAAKSSAGWAARSSVAASTSTAIVELSPETTAPAKAGDIVIMNNIDDQNPGAAPGQQGYSAQGNEDAPGQGNVAVVPYNSQDEDDQAQESESAAEDPYETPAPLEAPVNIKQTIPLSYGLLKGVAQQGNTVVLFFEDNAGTIRLIPMLGSGSKTTLEQPVAIERSSD